MNDKLKNDIWVLNPDYVFKNDKDRICMYSKNELHFDSTRGWIGFIHPIQAMILSLFTTVNNTWEVLNSLATHYNVPYDSLLDKITKFMGNSSYVYSDWKGTKVVFPKNVLVKFAGNMENLNYSFTKEDLEINTCEINVSQDRCHKGPHSALWMLTNKCTTECKYCYADRNTCHQPLTTDKILDLIEEFHQNGMSYIDIIGGEIFLRKDWNIILKRMVDLDMSPTYISTKMPLDESLVMKLKETGYKRVVQVSLDSVCDDTLKCIIRSREKYIEKIKKGITLLSDQGFNIQIDSVLTNKNSTIDEIKQLYEYISKIENLTLWEIRVPEASIYSMASFNDVKAEKHQLEEIRRYVEQLKKNSKNKVKIVFSASALDEQFRCEETEKEFFKGGSCGVLRDRVFILPDGKVSICEQLYWHKEYIIGDLKRSSMQEIWNSERALKIFKMEKDMFRKTSPCSVCSNFESCIGEKRRCLVKVLKAYGVEHWDYPDPRCVYAPEFSNDLIY